MAEPEDHLGDSQIQDAVEEEEEEEVHSTVPTTVTYKDDTADRVYIYISTDNFRSGIPMSLDPSDNQLWTCSLELPVGQHFYRFLVDGEWTCDEFQEIVCLNGTSYNELEIESLDAQDEEKESKMSQKKKAKRRKWRQKQKALKAQRRALGGIDDKTVDPKQQSEKLQAALKAFEDSQARKITSMTENVAKEKEQLASKNRQEREHWTAKINESQQEAEKARKDLAENKIEMNRLRETLKERVLAAEHAHSLKETIESLNATLQAEKAAIETQSSQHLEENKTLKRKMKSWKNEIEMKYRTMLEEATAKAENDGRNFQVNIYYLKKELDKAQKQKEEHDVALLAAQQDLTKITQERDAASSAVDEHKALLFNLTTKGKFNSEESDTLRREIQYLNNQLEELQQKNVGKELVSGKELQHLKQRESDLESELAAVKAAEKAVKDEIKLLREEKFVAASEVTTVQTRYEGETQELKAVHEKETTALTAEISDLKTRLEKVDFESKKDQTSSTIELEQAREQAKKIQQQLDEANEVKAKQEGEIKQLKEDKFKAEGGDKDVVNALNVERETLTKEKKELSAKLQALQEQLDTSQKNLTTLEQEKANLAELQTSMEKKATQVTEEHNDAIAKLNARLAQQQKEKEDKDKTLSQRQEALKKERDELIASHEKELKEVSGKLEVAEQESAKNKKSASDMEADSKVATEQRALLEAKIQKLEKTNTEEVAALQATIKGLEDAQAVLSASERKLSKEKTTIEAEKQKTETKLKEEIRVLGEKVEEQSKLVEERKNELETLQANDKRTKTQIEALTQQVEDLTKDRDHANEEHNKEVKVYNEQLAQAQLKVSDLVKESTELKNNLNGVKEAMKVREESLQREKKDVETRLVEVQEKSNKLKSALKVVAEKSAGLGKTVDAFKQSQLTFNQNIAKSLSIFEKTVAVPIEQHAKLLDDTLRKYKKELTERRKYFNLVQELRGNIRVCIRARPITGSDQRRSAEAKEAVVIEDNGLKVKRIGGDKDYEFDRVFELNTSQEEVFKDTKHLIGSVMDGYNVCIIAYGQTGSGKTHTMSGPAHDPGVNFRALRELFNIKKKRGEDYVYEISVSMLEIYNETLIDLLASDREPSEKGLLIRLGKDGVFVEGLTEREVQNEEEVMAIMALGSQNRAVGRTDMNEHSSRSHSILTVTVHGHNFTAGMTYHGKLHLIDLAGSERVSKSQAAGQRLKEAQAINKSLAALGNTLMALQNKQAHVPYRDSKLTYLLQDSLGGNSKCMMFINISPVNLDTDETFCSLEFAQKVSRVELGQATQNKSRSAPIDPLSPSSVRPVAAAKAAVATTPRQVAPIGAKPVAVAPKPAAPVASKPTVVVGAGVKPPVAGAKPVVPGAKPVAARPPMTSPTGKPSTSIKK